ELYRSDVEVVHKSIEHYVDMSTKMVEFFNRRDQGMTSEAEYTAFIAQFRQSGEQMVNAINDLSQQVNQQATQSLAQSDKDNIRVMNTAMVTVLSVLSLSLAMAWILSNMIVAPIQKLQAVMRELAQ
ncbi:methyl-accepting chemotaxis protein, partial [Vibrio anguillarum]|nr:methyl-accepting chemotaxis protein [Vibrio anguillarum]